MQKTFNKVIVLQFPMYSFFSCDALSYSLQNSNANLKMKTEKKGVEVHFLVFNTSGVKGACWSFGMKIETSDKWVNHSHEPTQTK
jgi:hypothetical protein